MTIKKEDLDRMMDAIANARDEARKAAEVAVDFDKKADLVSNPEAKELFQSARDRALAAMEHWHQASENLAELVRHHSGWAT